MGDLRGIRFPPGVGAIYEESRREGFDLVSEPMTGCLLRTLVCSKPGGSFLELGTGTGAATAWILDGMDLRSSLVTVDNDQRLLSIARRHLGADPRVTFVPADGNVFLDEAPRASFDLVFADTWPGMYENLESALGLLKEGYQARYVSLRGEVVAEDGAIAGGHILPAGLLGREREIDELTELLGESVQIERCVCGELLLSSGGFDA